MHPSRLLKPLTIGSAILVAVSNLFYLTATNLHPDEAYYWVWSRQLALGYFDNSPLIAYFIRLSTALGGNSEFWVRFPAWLGWLLVLFLIYRLANLIYHDQTITYLSVGLALFIPLVNSGSHLMTPDILMIIFAGITLQLLYQAVEQGQQTAWYGAGISLGLALLAKFQAALIPLAALIMILARPTKRRLLLQKEPYLALLIGLALFAPVLYWNATHHWAAFLFQTQHGIDQGIHLEYLGEFLSGQVGVFSLLFIALGYYTVKKLLNWRRLGPGDAFLIGIFLPVFLFFSLTSLTYPAGPNWPAVAYLPAIIFLAASLRASYLNLQPWGRKLLIGYAMLAILISILLLSVIRYPGFFIARGLNLKPDQVLSNRAYGWKELGQRIDQELGQSFPNQTRTVPVFGDGSYQIASELQFYVSRPIKVFTTRQARRSQFDYFTRAEIMNYDQTAGLLVLQDQLPANAVLYFDNPQPLGKFRVQRFGSKIRRLYLYRFDRLQAAAFYEMAQQKPLGYPGTYPD